MATKTSEKIRFNNVRVAFVQFDEAKPYEAGQKEYFSLDVLLDPSNPEHAKTIELVKAEGKRLALEEYGSIEGIKHKCFGKGDERKRAASNEVYAGYAGMFYVKLKAQADRAAVGGKHFGFVANRAAKTIAPGDPQWPYGGCYCNVVGTMWALPKNNPNIRHGKTIGGNLLTVQFVRDGEAFGGAGPVRVEDEFEVLDDTAPAVTEQRKAVAAGTDEWDD
jgi:Protein of unknown function (DUF2815)